MFIRQYITEYLQGRDWTAAGTIERYLLEFLPNKPDTFGRELRRLAENGLLLRREDKGYVEYRLGATK